MARSTPDLTVRVTLAEARQHARFDPKKMRATTEEDIVRQIAEDPDTAPDATTLGPPLPDPKMLRTKLGMSQAQFAEALCIPVGTLRRWEQRRSGLDPAAVSLLRIVQGAPEAAFKALGVKPSGARRTAGRPKKVA